MNKNCLSYWFPKLQEAGIPVPKTVIINWKDRGNLSLLLDGKNPEGFDELVFRIDMAALEVSGRVGYPVFLRTGQGSGKHRWSRTCFLAKSEDIGSHIFALVEWSHTVDFFGLAHNVWVVREMLPTKPVCKLSTYFDFPLIPEVRCFIKSGKVVCWHPYWPADAIENGFVHRPSIFHNIVRAAHDLDISEFMPIAEKVASAFVDDEPFSVDILPTERGWYVTDMALAGMSFHWEGCAEKEVLQ